MPITRRRLATLRSLATRKGRRAEGSFLAEGVRVLEEALRHGALPEVVYFANAGLSDRAVQLVDALGAAGARREEAEVWQIERAADVKTTQGLLGVFRIPAPDLSPLALPESRRVLVCDGVSDPGNLGTLLRSALAFDFRTVVLCGDSADPWAPKVVRSTAGAIFGLTLARGAVGDAIAGLRENGYVLVALAAGGEVAGDESLAERGARLALAVGAEGEGVSPETLEAAEVRWRIDHAADVESLHAAVAGSIAMREVYSASTRGG